MLSFSLSQPRKVHAIFARSIAFLNGFLKKRVVLLGPLTNLSDIIRLASTSTLNSQRILSLYVLLNRIRAHPQTAC